MGNPVDSISTLYSPTGDARVFPDLHSHNKHTTRIDVIYIPSIVVRLNIQTYHLRRSYVVLFLWRAFLPWVIMNGESTIAGRQYVAFLIRRY